MAFGKEQNLQSFLIINCARFLSSSHHPLKIKNYGVEYIIESQTPSICK